MSGRYEIATSPAVMQAAQRGAVFVFNMSGGKDSMVAAWAASRELDRLGHPRARRIAVHSDLGRAEWKSTLETVQRQADVVGLETIVLARKAGDLFARYEVRWANALQRYEALETYNLIGPWPQANKRFCTSELKAQVIGPDLARRYRGQEIVQVMGIRREESAARSKAPIWKKDTRFAAPANRHGTRMSIWHPVVDWSTDEVFECHREHKLPLHEAYGCYGSSRLSCAFCILAKEADLQAAASAEQNREGLRFLSELEVRSTFSFQPGKWLTEKALGRGLMSFEEAGRYAQALVYSEQRATIEAAMPSDLRYVAGWPPRLPTLDEADAIASARTVILHHHGLRNHFPDAHAVRERFAELIEMKARKAA